MGAARGHTPTVKHAIFCVLHILVRRVRWACASEESLLHDGRIQSGKGVNIETMPAFVIFFSG